MSIIASTRRGFLYQDRVAVAIYLEELLNRNIREYFVDYPWLAKKSIDIRYIDKNGREVVYEVKSGWEFKKDKTTGESSGVRDVILNLKEYLDKNPGASLNLLIKEEFSGRIVSILSS